MSDSASQPMIPEHLPGQLRISEASLHPRRGPPRPLTTATRVGRPWRRNGSIDGRSVRQIAMSDAPENLTLVFLRRLDAKIDRLAEDMREVKQRLTGLEIVVGNLAATESSHYAMTAERVDRLSQRIERIETRLDLREA